MDILLALLIYLILGAISGLVGGLLGMGGGIIIVPALYVFFLTKEFSPAVIMQLAICASLATIIITALRATWVHHYKKAVDWLVVVKLLPGLILGASIGALLISSLSSDTLRIAFGIFELVIALRIVCAHEPRSHQQDLPKTAVITLASTSIGVCSTLLGIGGGSLTIPFLLWCNVALRKAVAISAACGLPIAVFGTLGMIITGWNNSHLPPYTLGFLYWPAGLSIALAAFFFAPIGARLTHRLPLKTIRYSLAILLAAIGFKMLIN